MQGETIVVHHGVDHSRFEPATLADEATDAALLAQDADVLVMVARLNHLTRNQARRAVRVMSATRISPTGIIVTGDMDEPSYGYGYRYAAEKFETEEAKGVGTSVEKPRRSRV